jgi:glyoxylase-like metal-dependent hydrolase (beta-lactamase superfamily II)
MRLRLEILALALVLPTAGLFAQSKLAVQKLAEGVWAATPDRGGNVGWFLYGDGVVAVDSGIDNAIAKDILRQIAETTGGKPVRFLVLTHAHADHSTGAREFVAAGAQVICHENAAGPILAYVTQPARGASDPMSGKKVSPTLMTVSERLILFDGARRADIQWLGPAHTAGDLVVLLPNEKILFAGDLALNGRVPDLHLADADPGLWAKTLPRLAAAPVDKMVPGHGAIGPRTGISDTLAYVRGLDEVIQRLIRSGVPEEYVDIRLREPDNRILNVPLSDAHLANARAVYRRKKEELARPSPTPTPRAGTRTPLRSPAS